MNWKIGLAGIAIVMLGTFAVSGTPAEPTVNQTQETLEETLNRICQKLVYNFPDHMCEKLSLIMYLELKKEGIMSNVISGWKKIDGKEYPHAWLEVVEPSVNYETMGCRLITDEEYEDYRYGEFLRWWDE